MGDYINLQGIDYGKLKSYKANNDLFELLGGVTAEKARELYQGKKQNSLYLSLPIYPGMKQDEIDHVIKVVSNF